MIALYLWTRAENYMLSIQISLKSCCPYPFSENYLNDQKRMEPLIRPAVLWELLMTFNQLEIIHTEDQTRRKMSSDWPKSICK